MEGRVAPQAASALIWSSTRTRYQRYSLLRQALPHAPGSARGLVLAPVHGDADAVGRRHGQARLHLQRQLPRRQPERELWRELGEEALRRR